ncbi:M81 family metallopeptidase [Roseateles sp.]|jgi:microcystin degradation protein MlrC|uniref:M81 family metallopeptidase n=1 Tax=Roseateles sp. TaxID=1971397 RepID=UPI0037C7FB82
MRFFVAGMFHESSVFSPVSTGRASFSAWGDGEREPIDPIGAGQQVLGYGDLLDAVARSGHQALQGPHFEAQPAAPTDAATFADLSERIAASLSRAVADQANGGVQAVLLFLHGAQVAAGEDDCEGALLARLRQVPGAQDLPIGVLLDLHGNATAAMVRHASVLVACREYPHTDFGERARHLSELVARTANGEVQPRMWLWQLPMAGLLPTQEPEGQQLLAEMAQAQARPGVLSVSVFHGFAHADHADACASVVLVLDTRHGMHEEDSAWAIAEPLASRFARACETFAQAHPLMGTEAALTQARLAFDLRGGPVVLADRGDNAGAGGAGDTTHLLHALLKDHVRRPWPGMLAVAMIHDPAAVQQAHALGVGGEAEFELGGHCAGSGEPVRRRMRVRACRCDARQLLFGGPLWQPLGDSALLELDGVHIVVNSIRQQVFGAQVFSEHGLVPAACSLLVVKSTNHFQAGFSSMASHTVLSDPPGATGEDLSVYPWTRLRRPLWPLDALPLQERAHPRSLD